VASVQETGTLSLLGNYSFDEKTINIHPNDAYDLGLMTAEKQVKIFSGCTRNDFLNGTAEHTVGVLHLKNETRMGTLEVSLKTAGRLGRSKQVRVLYMPDDDGYGRLFIEALSSGR